VILRSVIRKEILNYFRSEDWLGPLKVMEQGREAVRHAHVYCDSILHPNSVTKLVEAYFRATGRPVERKIRLLSHGRGYTNVYYIQPKGMCHFEVFLKFNEDLVIAPMDAQGARGGKAFDYWGPQFMAEYLKQFDFRRMGPEEAGAVREYFVSPAWEQIYGVTMYDNERALHSHCIVDTDLSPDDILPIGQKALEAKGWDIDRAVSIVFNVNGHDQGKITYLVRRPELVLELEWNYVKGAGIRPAHTSMARLTTMDMVDRDIAGVPYLVLNADDVAWVERELGL
jgi:hypothetical protein